MKKERGQKKIRGKENRKRNKFILICAEGNNKTETNYFKRFRISDTNIYFTHGNETDPEKMMERLLQEAAELDMDPEYGDHAYCLVDGDVNPQKDTQIASADRIASKSPIAKQIVSNPCFEVWYYCHFQYSTRQYRSSSEAVDAFKRDCMDNYTKERRDMFDALSDKLETACQNAERLRAYNTNAGHKAHTAVFQPSTEVDMIIRDITGQ